MMKENDLVLVELARKLMHDVYHPFSACVVFDEIGKICDLYVFDTLYCQPRFPKLALAHQCILISHHFDGSIQPYTEDLCSFKAMKNAYPDQVCSLMIYSEANGLIEIDDAHFTKV